VVPFGAGGPTDIYTRIVAEGLQNVLPKVITDNHITLIN